MRRFRARGRAHPRSRGENGCPARDGGAAQGSSPLTRGKPTRATWQGTHPGLIPAHAGKTVEVHVGDREGGAHPRSRGENCQRWCRSCRWSGSSPLTRGKPHHQGRVGPTPGLIPAHAGKTPRAMVWSAAAWAHPRSRGENSAVTDTNWGPNGSSPLTRGKRHFTERLCERRRLIPAHAGKTIILTCLIPS